MPGDYQVQIKGCSKDSPTLCDFATFTITLLDACDPPTEIATPDYNDIVYTLEQTGVSQPRLPFVATRGAIQCPVTADQITYTPLPDGRTSVSDNGSAWSIFWTGDDYPLGKSEKVRISVQSSSKYGSSSPITASVEFTITFDSPCDKAGLTQIIATQQTNPAPDQYTGQDVVFTYNPFQTIPSYCQLTVECEQVSPENAFIPCKNLDSNGQIKYNFPFQRYTNRDVPPGSYVITFSVTSDPENNSNNDPSLTKTFDVVITLEDPCTPDKVQVQLPTSNPMTYTLTTLAVSQTLSGSLIVTPPFCYDSDRTRTQAPASCDISNELTFSPSGPKITVGPITDRLTPANPNNVPLQTESVCVLTTIYETCDFQDNC